MFWSLCLKHIQSRLRCGSVTEALFRCSQTAKTFGEMSTFWKNGSKQGLVKLGCKDLEFGTLEPKIV